MLCVSAKKNRRPPSPVPSCLEGRDAPPASTLRMPLNCCLIKNVLLAFHLPLFPLSLHALWLFVFTFFVNRILTALIPGVPSDCSVLFPEVGLLGKNNRPDVSCPQTLLFPACRPAADITSYSSRHSSFSALHNSRSDKLICPSVFLSSIHQAKTSPASFHRVAIPCSWIYVSITPNARR